MKKQRKTIPLILFFVSNVYILSYFATTSINHLRGVDFFATIGIAPVVPESLGILFTLISIFSINLLMRKK